MDIDLDLPTTFNPKSIFNVVRGSIITDGVIKPHPCGVYFQSMPTDPVSGLAAIPYKQAGDHGFTKIDFLHLSALDQFTNKDQIRVLINTAPKWGLLLKADVVAKLFQLSNNLELLRKIQPTSIMEIADCISLIRPGRLKLVDDYLRDRINTRKKLYTISKGDVYSYKKGHAIAYAMIVVLQLHLIASGNL
jgi:DNA polymerase III alpha subunit